MNLTPVALEKLRNNDQTLLVLDLSSSYIDLDNFRALIEALNINTTLQTLNLSDCGLDLEHIKMLAEALKTNTTLQTLNLCLNHIAPEGIRALTETIKINIALKTLTLSLNNLNTEGIINLAKALKINTTLETLELDSNNLGSADTTMLAEALKANTTLKVLNLANNHLGSEAINALAEALKTNTTLETLNLDNNDLGSAGATMLAETLLNNKTLKTVNLNKTNLGSAGVIILTEALHINRTLRSLSLNWNCTDLESSMALAEMIKNNTSLETLHLVGNNLHLKRGKTLTEAFKANTTLRVLDISSNNLCPDGIAALAEIIEINTALQCLSFNWCNIDNESTNTLIKALKNNYTLLELHNLGNATSEKFTPYLKQNNDIYDCLDALHQFYKTDHLDLDALNKNIHKLTELAPEVLGTQTSRPNPHYLPVIFSYFNMRPNRFASLSDKHYLFESYLLLAALSHLRGGNPNQSIPYLCRCFAHPQLQIIADKALAEALIATNAFVTADTNTQKARYQYLAYQHRHEPQSALFQLAIHGLEHPKEIFKVAHLDPIQHKKSKHLLLPYQSLWHIAQKTYQSIKNKNKPETYLLLACLKQKKYDRMNIKTLFQLPVFIKTLKEHYPKAQYIQCLETMLFFKELNKTYDLSTALDTLSAITSAKNVEDISERYRITHHFFTKHTPQPSLCTNLNRIKTILNDFIEASYSPNASNTIAK